MQVHNNIPLTQIEIDLIVAAEKLSFWFESLLDIRQERKEIIADETASPEWRKHALIRNRDVTTAIRGVLADAQEHHGKLLKICATSRLLNAIKQSANDAQAGDL